MRQMCCSCRIQREGRPQSVQTIAQERRVRRVVCCVARQVCDDVLHHEVCELENRVRELRSGIADSLMGPENWVNQMLVRRETRVTDPRELTYREDFGLGTISICDVVVLEGRQEMLEEVEPRVEKTDGLVGLLPQKPVEVDRPVHRGQAAVHGEDMHAVVGAQRDKQLVIRAQIRGRET